MTRTRSTPPENYPAEHQLPSSLLARKIRITVVGCGGTGSAIACGLPYLHQSMVALGHPYGLDVTLVDGDLVSKTNCVRQPFSISDVGLHKVIVLANRINLFWGFNWKAVPQFLDEKWKEETDILIGCVDTRAARNKMTCSPAYGHCSYVLDVGNSYDSGQFVLGQPKNPRNNKCRPRLPTVAELYPEIIDPALDGKDTLPSCSDIQALTNQAAFVNQTLAYQALAMLATLFREGQISHHGCFLNLSQGRMVPLPIRHIGAKKRSRSLAK
jgi:PRTRC genetic system ThiF family protein